MVKVRGARAVRRTAVAAAFGLLVSAVVLGVPSLRFAYRSTAGHLVLETAVTLVAGAGRAAALRPLPAQLRAR